MPLIEKGAPIEPPEGKLGILLPGLGAVSTTFIAGVEAVIPAAMAVPAARPTPPQSSCSNAPVARSTPVWATSPRSCSFRHM